MYACICSVICETGPSVHGEMDREVRVTVVDSTRSVVPFNIRGSALSNHVSFAYKVCCRLLYGSVLVDEHFSFVW